MDDLKREDFNLFKAGSERMIKLPNEKSSTLQYQKFNSQSPSTLKIIINGEGGNIASDRKSDEEDLESFTSDSLNSGSEIRFIEMFGNENENRFYVKSNAFFQTMVKGINSFYSNYYYKLWADLKKIIARIQMFVFEIAEIDQQESHKSNLLAACKSVKKMGNNREYQKYSILLFNSRKKRPLMMISLIFSSLFSLEMFLCLISSLTHSPLRRARRLLTNIL